MKPELVSSVGSRLPEPGPCSVAVAPEPLRSRGSSGGGVFEVESSVGKEVHEAPDCWAWQQGVESLPVMIFASPGGWGETSDQFVTHSFRCRR
jgi:hypothetical protein